MYNKIFTKILDSSIWSESVTTRIVWVTFLAAMDEDGFVQFAGVDNVAARARVSRKQAEAAIAILEAPDADSADPDNDGRRIERVQGGWLVLNSEKYRQMVTRVVVREQTRDRVRRFRGRKKAGNAVVTPKKRGETQSEAYSESEADIRGVVVKAESTATDISATKRFLGAPNGTPLKFEHETTKLLANGLTPKDLGFLLEPSQYAHQELAWAITRLVASRNLHGLPEKRKAAVELLHDASRTPAGLKIETLDLRRVSPAWVKITTDRLIEIAADVYGVSDGRLFGATA